MKQSESFKEAVDSSFVEAKAKKLLKEASYIPTGVSTANQDAVNGRGTPGSSHSGSREDGMLGIEMQPDSQTMAPPHMPYPLETILNHLADGFSGVNSSKNLIDTAVKNPLLSRAQIDKLRKLQAELKMAADNVRKVALEIQKINLA